MLIEVMFPEICNLYGDSGNIRYIKSSVKEAQIIYTPLNTRPYFADHKVDLIYMGSMTEKSQLLAIEAMKEYKTYICENIDVGTHFLITGNALEIFGKEIKDVNGAEISGLGVFDVCVKRDMLRRYNSLYLGKCGDIEIVGYKSQFTYAYYNDEKSTSPLFITQRGIGFNKDTQKEGLKRNNFMATYVIGPLLILNPYFTKKFLKDIGVENPILAYEKENLQAYEQRLNEYKNPHTGFTY